MAGSSSRSVEDEVGDDRRLRQCPTLPGDLQSLITHQIEHGLCQRRQREYYHKCHRCVYRGKPVDWVFDASRNGTGPDGRAVAKKKA